MKLKTYCKLSAVILAIAVLCSCNSQINTTEKLVKAMTSRYGGKWFKQIAFDQTTSFFENGKVIRTESWHEIYKFPSMLFIAYDHQGSGNGQIYRNDSVYIFKDHELEASQYIIHDLLVLSMDIYNLSFDKAMQRIGQLDYDPDKFHTRMYENRKVYVVGASDENDKSNQFWIDAEHLYFVKMIKKRDYGVQEIELRNYIEIDNSGWIEQEVVFKLDGELCMIEKYYNIKIPESEADESIFSPSVFSSQEVLKSILRYIEFPDIHIFDYQRHIVVLFVDVLSAVKK